MLLSLRFLDDNIKKNGSPYGKLTQDRIPLTIDEVNTAKAAYFKQRQGQPITREEEALLDNEELYYDKDIV